MIERLKLKTLALGHVLLGSLSTRLGIRKPVEGWRRIVGVGLREEHAKFAVAAFGLNPPANLLPAISEFIRNEPEAYYQLAFADHLTYRIPTKHIDVVQLSFDPAGRLISLETSFDEKLPATEVEIAQQAVRDAYNATANLPEPIRPLELHERIKKQLANNLKAYQTAVRILAAVCITIDQVPEADRFAPPALAIRRGLGYGHLAFVIRPWDDGVDVWAYTHHTGTDGVPLQEMVTRLEKSWGIHSPVSFPESTESTHIQVCHVPNERPVYESISFHDFRDLLALRKKLNAERTGSESEITFGSLFMWLLGKEAEFQNCKLGSTVDVAAMNGAERCVGMVSLRPAEYPNVSSFAQAYESALRENRLRKGPSHAAVKTAALLPPYLHRAMLAKFPETTDDLFGSVGLSILREASLFIAPYTDVGFPGGFIAIGNVNLPTATGQRVGAVSVKGDRETVERIPAVIRRALSKINQAAAVLQAA